MLTTNEIKRYNRHIILPEVGMSGQEKLKNAKVFVVGAGGLGSPVLLYLAAAGVGTIGIADDDNVDESNLQRQVLYTSDDVGKPKALHAKKKLLALNPNIEVVSYQERVNRDNILNLISKYDIVVDGSDNFSTRYLVSDACVILKKPLVFGSIFKFEGQVSVFNYNDGPTYRCLYPDQPGEDEVPNCSQIGVIGVLPGIIGTLQANEVIKIITGIGEVLSGKLLMFDALLMDFNTISFRAIPENKNIISLGVYEDLSCEVMPIRELEYQQFIDAISDGKIFQLIDVRNPEEFDVINMGGELIPIKDLESNIHKISRTDQVLLICQSGIRSKKAAEMLQSKFGYTNVFSLKGGINENIVEIQSAQTNM